MAARPLIVFFCIVCVGCGAARPPWGPGGAPHEGGSVRLWLDDADGSTPSDRERVLDLAIEEGYFTVGTEPGVLRKNGSRADRLAYLDEVVLLDSGGADPALLARLGQLDLALVYGRRAARIREDLAATGGTMTRLPGWDRTYLLWLNPGTGRRWTRDPEFRAWLRGQIDGEEMVEYVFAGEAEPAHGPWSVQRSTDVESRWRVPTGIRPRVTLSLDEDDPLASAVGARLKAEIEELGVT
ncbi:MAG: hypothetical protein R3344_08975, partial [Acidobacteriota bacterium]|nr:hypothetical protein [Acidobacteriota bacterium]